MAVSTQEDKLALKIFWAMDRKYFDTTRSEQFSYSTSKHDLASPVCDLSVICAVLSPLHAEMLLAAPQKVITPAGHHNVFVQGFQFARSFRRNTHLQVEVQQMTG